LLGYKVDEQFLAPNFKFLAGTVNITTSNFIFLTCSWVQNMIRHTPAQSRHVNLLESGNASRLLCDVFNKTVLYKLNLKLLDNFS